MCSVMGSLVVAAKCSCQIFRRDVMFMASTTSKRLREPGSRVDVFSGYVNLHQKIRMKSNTFSRVPVRVYVPEQEGIVGRRESWAKLPKQKPETVEDPGTRTSGEIFKNVMGNIYATKSKRLIAVEGHRQVDDAISFGLNLKFLFILKSLKSYPDNIQRVVENGSKQDAYSYDSKPTQTEIHQVSLQALQEWSSLQTPPGIVGIFERPSSILTKKNSCASLLPLTVVLDNVREPGNLGSILRTAAGIGCKVLLSEGCADPWETKSLRGGNGAQFLIPMATKIDLQYLQQHIPQTTLRGPSFSDSSESVRCEDDENKNIGKIGIGVFLADVGTGPDKFDMPIVDYTTVNYSKFESIILILGGETTGLRYSTRKAVKELTNYYPEEIKLISRIRIPMCLPIDSLNVANAFGILGYEISRQLSSTSTL